MENIKIKVQFDKNDFKREVSEMASAFFGSVELEFLQKDKTEFIVTIQGRVDGGVGSFEISTGELDEDVHVSGKIIKRKTYQLFSEYAAKKLPWGTMTGIRPVKLYRKLYEENEQNEQNEQNGQSDKDEQYDQRELSKKISIAVKKRLKEDYFVSEEKIEIMEKIFNCENKHLTVKGSEEFSVYVGIPFCPSRCAYCSFSSVKARPDRMDIKEYLEKLMQEIKGVGEEMKGKSVQSIYIGGGTPGVLEPEEIKRLIDTLQDFFPGAQEITYEGGRSDALDRGKLTAALAAGASRISINPQTMNEEVLASLGRNHSAEDVRRVFNEAREVGFRNINMDLILGLPGETWQSFMASVEAVIELAPESITVHALSLKKASEFMYSGLKHLETNRPDISELIRVKLESAGYEPYYLYRQKNTFMNLENVGYSKPGFESIFNIQSMADIQSCIAFGADAVTKLITQHGIVRIHNPKYPNEYNGKIEELIEKKKIALMNLDLIS